MGDGYASSYDGITHFDPEEDRGSDPGIDCGGAVLFTNNNCQLEAWGTGVRGYCSVQIISADHVLFANNHLWFDGPRMSALMDAFLFGLSLQKVHAPHKFLVDSHNLVLHSQLCSRKLVVKVKRTGQTTEKEQEKP